MVIGGFVDLLGGLSQPAKDLFYFCTGLWTIHHRRMSVKIRKEKRIFANTLYGLSLVVSLYTAHVRDN